VEKLSPGGVYDDLIKLADGKIDTVMLDTRQPRHRRRMV